MGSVCGFLNRLPVVLTMAGDIVGILLAAGKGRRFGSDKLLHPLPGGTPMAVAVARKLRQACGHAIAVLRPEQQPLGKLLAAEGYEIRFSVEAEGGMGHSLAEAVKATPDAAGWLVALADMPFVAVGTFCLVAYALRGGASLAAPFHEGRRGHPVGFSRQWFGELAGLTGDQGARRIVAKNPGHVVQVPCNDAGVLVDVDTPDALAGFG